MGFADKTHWIGVFLLFAASILLLITCISAPVVNELGLLKVRLPNDAGHVEFGSFGYCILGGIRDICTHSKIGYDPARVVAQVANTSFESIASGTSTGLTRVMVLHAVACGIAFLAFLIACGAGIIGSFAGALVALLAWILTLVSLICDFVLFGIIKAHVDDDTNAHATFGAAIWTLLAAFICLFFGMFIVFFTCCANRREKRKRDLPVEKQSPPRRRKRFGLF